MKCKWISTGISHPFIAFFSHLLNSLWSILLINIEETDYKLQVKFVSNVKKVNIVIFNLKMSILETGPLAAKMFLAQINGQFRPYNLGTFDLGKLPLDRTFPLNNYCLFTLVKTKISDVHLIGKWALTLRKSDIMRMLSNIFF